MLTRCDADCLYARPSSKSSTCLHTLTIWLVQTEPEAVKAVMLEAEVLLQHLQPLYEELRVSWSQHAGAMSRKSCSVG
jgi:hypothetical protein